MTFEINTDFEPIEGEILSAFQNFEKQGTVFFIGERNNIKIFEINGHNVNIKSFKIPIKTHQFIYHYLRKSKAKRSFENANILLQKGINTPKPIAFQENYGGLGLQTSFYASLHQHYDLTFRELIEVEDYPDKENILRQFTQFCYKMHEAGVEFKDHSPGNTIIEKLNDGKYDFYLVDLNRMKFHQQMDINLRMKNLSRLTPKKEMVKIMSDEYAKASNMKTDEIFELLWDYTSNFFKKYHRRESRMEKIRPFLK